VQVVDALTIFIEKEGRWLSIAGFYPVGEQPSLVGFIPKILVEICVSDFLKRVYFVGRNEMAIKIHESQRNFLEDSLGEKMSLDS
jgi:hypothetical protein